MVFGLTSQRGRWLFIPLGIIVLLCAGTVYSWSIFRKPLEDLLGISATESVLPFTVCLIVSTLLMPIAGFFTDKYGVRIVTAIGGFLIGLSYILSGLAKDIPTLVITYGIIGGAGIGIASVGPVAVSAQWFPDKKGLAIGLTGTGFGLSPLVTAPWARYLIESYGVPQTFMYLGTALAVIIMAISIVLKMPPSYWITSQTAVEKNASLEANNNLAPMLRSLKFYGLWLCYLIGSFLGISAISISSPFAQEILNIELKTSAITVSVFAVFNAIGRILFGWLTEEINTQKAAIISYILMLIGSLLMISADEGDALTYLVGFSLFWFSFGGWLAIAGTATMIWFGSKNYAKNYGIIFTAYGLGALLGPLAASHLRDTLGNYICTFYLNAALATVGIIIAVFML